jgi:hypothetical protein
MVRYVDICKAQDDPVVPALGPVRGPFDRLDWLALLAQECLPGQTAFVALAEEAGRAAALPLAEDGPRRFSAVGNWYSFWRGPLGEPDLLYPIARALAGRADAILLSHLPEDTATVAAAAFRRAGWLAFSAPCDRNHFVATGGRSFAEYWAARPGQLRETVRRKGRKGVVSLAVRDRFDPAAWAAYEHVYGLSWKPGEGMPDFLRRFAEAESNAGRLRLGIATIDGTPVAAQFWTIEAGTAFIHKLAHDEAARKHSPGTLLSAALFEHVIDRDRVAEIDFGTGDDAYKRDWMEQVRIRHSLSLYRPTAIRSLPLIVRAALKRLTGRNLQF